MRGERFKQRLPVTYKKSLEQQWGMEFSFGLTKTSLIYVSKFGALTEHFPRLIRLSQEYESIDYYHVCYTSPHS